MATLKLEIVTLPSDTQPATTKPYLLRQPGGTNLYCHQAPANFKKDLLTRLSQ